ncbi:ABC transporter family protein [Rhodococcus sp. MTM3W5.2]|nr:ATP-binding cassette domain-containing protein [Rhodococcus sp. MTM3W5.2]AQA21350.1 ABC transporter family protein [Rhodococcus sp. MTM3W5.2]
MSSPALELSGISKSFGKVQALRGVDLAVQPGTVHCILGENGAGKSTVCNLVYGGYRPDAGAMTLGGAPYAPASPAAAMAAGVAMVHQHFSLISTMTVAENLMLTGSGFLMRRAHLERRLERLADEFKLRVDLDATVSAMPIGARQKVEIVKALLGDPSLILLDEPTGVLDPGEIDALIGTCQAVAASGKSVVMVTHKLGEVARVADAATVLRGGEVAGGGRMSELTIPQLLTSMVGRPVSDLNPALAASLGIDAEAPDVVAPDMIPAPTGSAILTLDGLAATRGDGSVALAGVRLEVRPHEIVGVAGVEGNGQSELVAIISGSLRPDSGTVTLGDVDITTMSPRRGRDWGSAWYRRTGTARR